MAKQTRNALVHTQPRKTIDQYRIFTDCRFEPRSAPQAGQNWELLVVKDSAKLRVLCPFR